MLFRSTADDRVLRISITLKGRPVRSYVFKKEQLVIGRSPDADVFLDNPGVSREHLRLERARNGDYVLQDVGSANGTLLNDQPVTSKRLYDKDVIQIGKFSLQISYEYDRRGEISNRKLNPGVEDGTMVLSSAELQEMIKKAHAAEGEALKGPWPNGQGAPTKAEVRRARVQRIITFALGVLVGAGGMFAIQHYFKL